MPVWNTEYNSVSACFVQLQAATMTGLWLAKSFHGCCWKWCHPFKGSNHCADWLVAVWLKDNAFVPFVYWYPGTGHKWIDWTGHVLSNWWPKVSTLSSISGFLCMDRDGDSDTGTGKVPNTTTWMYPTPHCMPCWCPKDLLSDTDIIFPFQNTNHDTWYTRYHDTWYIPGHCILYHSQSLSKMMC